MSSVLESELKKMLKINHLSFHLSQRRKVEDCDSLSLVNKRAPRGNAAGEYKSGRYEVSLQVRTISIESCTRKGLKE